MDRTNDKINNPITKKPILVITALSYPKNHPVYKAAKNYLNKEVNESAPRRRTS